MNFRLSIDEIDTAEVKEINNLFTDKSTLSDTKSIILDTAYNQKDLESLLRLFIQTSNKLTPDNLKLKYNKLHNALSKYNEILYYERSRSLSLSYLEHSHYIFSYLSLICSEEERVLIESRLTQFDDDVYPNESYYLILKKTIKFISTLMCKWGIFDINNYNFRFKGRCLSLNLINIKNINLQSITLDILWFTYAINHEPFRSRIPKSLFSYAKIVQLQFNTLFSFIIANDLSENSFIFPSFLQKLFKKSNTQLDQLYSLLKSSELAYRYFEKNLIEEFLKLI